MFGDIAAVFFEEVQVIFRYALFPTLFSLLLTFVDWNYSMIMSMINLFVFLRLVYNEDQTTGFLKFRYICVKLIAATLLYYAADYAATSLDDILPPGLYGKSLSSSRHDLLQDSLPSGRMRVPKSKAKSALSSKKTSDVWTKAEYFIVRVVEEFKHPDKQ